MLCCSVAKSCLTLCDAVKQHARLLSFTASQSILKLMCTGLVMLSTHLILCHPLLLLPLIFPSIRIFSNDLVLHIRCPKYWSFSFRISPSNEYSGRFPLGLTGLISLQFKGLARVFSNSIVKSINSLALSLLYGPTLTSYVNTGKTIALTR